MRILGWTLLILVTHAGLAARADQPPTFEQDVRPILKAYCLDCHGGGEKLKGRLDLRLKRFAVRGGTSGPAVVPGEPDESLLLEPHAGRRDAAGREEGARRADRRRSSSGSPRGRRRSATEPESLPPGIGITPEERAYWAFQPLRRPEPPPSGPDDRVRTPIDAFVLAKLREQGLAFDPDADRRTLHPPRHARPDRACRRRRRRSRRSSPTSRPTPTSGWSTGCWRRPPTASGGAGTGSTWPATPTPTATAPTTRRGRTPGSTATTSSARSTPTSRSTGSSSSSSPATNWCRGRGTNLTPEQIELLAATGFLRTAPDGTATGGATPLAPKQVVADTLKIVGSALLGPDGRLRPVPRPPLRPDPAGRLLPPPRRVRAGPRPAALAAARPAARLALHRRRPRQRRGRRGRGAGDPGGARREDQPRYVAAAFEKELAKFPEDVRGKLRAAFDTPADKRTDEQKKLAGREPEAEHHPGVLYQYDPKAADELKKDAERIAAKRAEKPAEDFVSVLDEVPGVVPETRIYHRGDYRQPKSAVGPGDLTIAAPDGQRFEIAAEGPGSADHRPAAGVRPAPDRRHAPAVRPRAGQPHLAAPLRPRHRRHARRLRRARAAADAPGAARLAGRRARPRRAGA